jgi:phenylpyruvate tautomerase PptA (4-oxalocrotonate tautomerase family)
MPILEVELIRAPDDAPRAPGLSSSLADAAALVLRAEPGRVWVRYRERPADDYAENGIHDPPHPVFVSVLRRELPPRAELAVEASALATALAPLLGRPIELVHVIYEPPGAGRVAFGGRLV